VITAENTLMFQEAAQAANVVAEQTVQNAASITQLAKRLRAHDVQIIFTCARGSSDHAATFAKYLFETRFRIPTVSQAPSLASLYGGAFLHMQGQPFILISQSGKSPDLLLSAEAAKKAGAIVIALVNDTESPLAKMAEIVIPLCAGLEKSVAATKSYIASLSTLVQLVAQWTQDPELKQACDTLPEALTAAWSADWSTAVELFAEANSLFVLGRGLSLSVAQEAALKLKETSGIHGEAFSLAEVAHGPMALIKNGFPLLVLPPNDKGAEGLETMLMRFVERGAKIAVSGHTIAGCSTLPFDTSLHSVVAPIVQAQSLYRMINALSVKRGYDPDHPPLLNKVTQTL
jgi:glutamine---fructose-6-phosphate transaminase (isomerizing)